MRVMGLLILGVFLFLLLVIIHEYGHYLVARRNGVDVEEFGIGFPPRVYGRVMGKGIFRTFYSINALPVGGFVKLKGETDADTRKGSFGAANLATKIKIMLAGVGMNFVAAIVIFTLLAVIGMPVFIQNQFTVASDTSVTSSKVIAGFVSEGSPAEQVGVSVGDELVRIDDASITNAEEMFSITESRAGQTVEVAYVKDGREVVATTTLNANSEDQGYFGVSPGEVTLQRSTWSAPVTGVGLTGQLSWLTLKGLAGLVADLFAGNGSEAAESVSGPVGVFSILKDVSLIGFQYVLFFIGVISLTLAVMNALPIPALDGGRLFVTLLFRTLKKPLTPNIEQAIHGTGMIVLMGLIILITVVDVRRFF